MILAGNVTEKQAADRLVRLIVMLNEIDYELQKIFAPDEVLNELHNSICDIGDELSYITEDLNQITENENG